MEPFLILGGIGLVLSIVIIVVIVSLSKEVGRGEAKDALNKIADKRRLDADEVLTESVADEEAWVKKQLEEANRHA